MEVVAIKPRSYSCLALRQQDRGMVVVGDRNKREGEGERMCVCVCVQREDNKGRRNTMQTVGHVAFLLWKLPGAAHPFTALSPMTSGFL